VAARRADHSPEVQLRERVGRLAAQLSEVSDRLDQALTRIAQTSDRHAALAVAVSEGLSPDLAELQQVVDDELGKLRGHVDVLLAEREQQKSSRNPPVDWAALDAAQAAAAWPILARWVGEVLVPRYELTRDQLPDCWAWHRPVVNELSWLRVAYVAAHQPRAIPQSAADWHTRWLPAVLVRIREVVKTDECFPGQHTPRRGPVDRWDDDAGDTGAARQHLALPRCWWRHYELAYAADLASRRARADTGQQNWAPRAAQAATA
jgi:hypothetical protein